MTGDEKFDPEASRADPLRAMYFIAALVMAIAFLVIVVMMFIPPDFFSRSDPDELFVPGSGEAYDAPAPPPPVSRAEAEALEELHQH
jgi:hypothetical protein